MEIGNVTRTATPAGPVVPQRIELAAASGAVRTELPEGAAVTQATEKAAVRLEAGAGLRARVALDATLRDGIERRLSIETEIRSVVFKATDRQTGVVVRQVPDEALLRIRAYARAQIERNESPADADTSRVERIA